MPIISAGILKIIDEREKKKRKKKESKNKGREVIAKEWEINDSVEGLI